MCMPISSLLSHVLFIRVLSSEYWRSMPAQPLFEHVLLESVLYSEEESSMPLHSSFEHVLLLMLLCLICQLYIAVFLQDNKYLLLNNYRLVIVMDLISPEALRNVPVVSANAAEAITISAAF